jgi:ribosomal protein S18 acetylase RimI-like enzyme
VRAAVPTAYVVRPYAAADQPSWLRCRALAFLTTCYYDDVVRTKPTYDSAVELVAVDRDQRVIGVLDVAVVGPLATIETVAVHPDHQAEGIATALLEQALTSIPSSVATLDAWTREDLAANEWYLARGFHETFRYLHVYATDADELAAAGVASAQLRLATVTAFFHGDIRDEESLRARFARVYRCHRYERSLR